MLQKIQSFMDTLSRSMVGRDAEIRTITLALLAREHCCLIGDPGTGKSFLIGNVIKAVAAPKFEILMTPFTTPEEVFGPFRLTELQKDNYIRNLADRMCESWLSFMDEGYKASSAILNSMLTMMQERAFDNGGQRIKCPLHTMVLASNELPEPGILDALHDRFVIRRWVKPVPRSMRPQLLDAFENGLPPVTQVCTTQDFEAAHRDAMQIRFKPGATVVFNDIWNTLEDQGVKIGDRRAQKAQSICRAAAYLDGASHVEAEHLECLADVFWNSEDEIASVRSEVLRQCNPDEIILNEFAEELERYSVSLPTSPSEVASALTKLRNIVMETCALRQTKKCLAIQAEAQETLDKLESANSGTSIEMLRRLRAATARAKAAKEAESVF